MLRSKDKGLLLGNPARSPALERVLRGGRLTQHEASFATVFGNFLTANASANTKAASWTSCIDPLAFDADGFYLHTSGLVNARDYLIDIAVGPSGGGSETIILADYQACTGIAFREHSEVYIPLPLTAGQRVSARCQASSGSATLHVGISPCRGPMFEALRKRTATTYGANTGDSGGTSVDPGGSASTWSATWTTIDAAVANRIDYAIVCHGNQVNAGRTAAGMLWQLGIGAASSEVAITAPLLGAAEAGNDIIRPYQHMRHVSVPAGSRLSCRAMCEITDATDRLSDIIVIGFH